MIRIRTISRVVAFSVIAAVTIPSYAQVTLLSEDFEGLTLLNSVDEGVAGPIGDGGGTVAASVWTNVPPASWIDDDTGVPGIGNPSNNNGVFDWAGWNFANRDWWVTTAGDQRRSEFVNASGAIMVADPDEWDDANHPGGPPGGPWYDTFISTPSISLTGIQSNSVTLDFDSSWRPEFDSNFHQTANIVVSYDGGIPIEILRWESNAASPDFHDNAPNEHVTLGLTNPPGAGSMVLTFGLFDAGNDWWWALDNIVVEGLSALMHGNLSISDVTVNEEDGVATLTVSRLGGSDGAVGVNFMTNDGTAEDETGSGDYVSQSNTLNWADTDSTDRSIILAITDDDTMELTESFTVSLFGATGGAAISDDTGLVTILDTDEALPVFTLNTGSLAVLALIMLFLGMVYTRRVQGR